MSIGESLVKQLTWRTVLAAGLLLRPVLIAPMAPSGPLRGSAIVPVALASLLAFHVLLAIGALVGNRLAIAFGILTCLVGVLLAAIGVLAGLPAPWPQGLVAWNLALAVVGIKAWWELPAEAASG